jgi:hypothetical protein
MALSQFAQSPRNVPEPPASVDGMLKDSVLNWLADFANVAQFVSFAPGVPPKLRFLRVRGSEPNVQVSISEALSMLLAAAPEGTVNVRSFLPGEQRSLEFIYGLSSVDDVTANVLRLASTGLYTTLYNCKRNN